MTVMEFEPLEYLSIPYMSGRASLSLAHSLRDNAPAEDLRPKQVEASLARMAEVAAKLDADFANRLREASSEVLALEGEFDGACDAAFVDTRDRLRSLARYDRPGFQRLAEEPEAKVDYAALVDRGRRARVLGAKLFSAEGLTVLRRSYAEQAVSTAAIVRVIDEDGLAAELDEVLGEDMFAVLRDLQRRYEAMVTDRAARETSANLIREHRAELRGAIKLYATTVLGMLDPSDEASVAVVEASLRPILSFRARYVNSGGAAAADELDDELDDGLDDGLDDELDDELEPQPPALLEAEAS